ncbi:MAG: hypothetical protein ACTSRK_19875 [Promethearchaeota archaeon]
MYVPRYHAEALSGAIEAWHSGQLGLWEKSVDDGGGEMVMGGTLGGLGLILYR